MLANIHETEGPRHAAAIDVTLRLTVTLAPECHVAVERNRLKIAYADDEAKCNAPLIFTGILATGKRLAEPYVSTPRLTPQEARLR